VLLYTPGFWLFGLIVYSKYHQIGGIQWLNLYKSLGSNPLTWLLKSTSGSVAFSFLQSHGL
jgi:hypothetical protein